MATILYLPWNKETLYAPVPSLEQMTAVKIAVILWNRTDIKALMDDCQDIHNWVVPCFEPYDVLQSKFYFRDQPTFVDIEAKTKCYARELVLSEGALYKVLGIIKPIGLQIFFWKNEYSCGARLPKELIWNVFGTIEFKKTAQALVNDCNMSLELRYKIACAYCLEDDIINLWGQLSKEAKEAVVTPQLCVDDVYSMFRRRQFADELVILWSQAMQQEGDLEKIFERLDTFSDYGILLDAVVDCNHAALEYFLPKMTSSAKREFLLHVQSVIFHAVLTNPYNYRHESYLWLLLQIKENQLTEVIVKKAIWALIWCLDWPWQDLFMPVANRLKPFLSCSNVTSLLINMTYKVIQGYQDYNYQQLFTEFWELCTETAKRYAIKEFATDFDLLTCLFSIGDKRNVQLILKDATDEELIELISYNMKICLDLQYNTPNDQCSEDAAAVRWLSLFLLQFVVSEEFNKRAVESKAFGIASGYDFQHVLIKFWGLCPEIVKECIIKEFASDCGLPTHLSNKNLQQILKDATDEELKQIIFYYRKRCMASKYDSPRDQNSGNDAKLRWLCLFLLEFLVSEEFH